MLLSGNIVMHLEHYPVFEPDLNFTVPGKFPEAPFRANLTPLGLQKLHAALVAFAPPRQGPRLKFRKGASETISPALAPNNTIIEI